MQRNRFGLFWRILSLCVFFVATGAFTMDYPSEFVQNPGGNLALSGFPGYSSTPARLSEPGFGLSYTSLGDVELRVAGIAGEMCLGCRLKEAIVDTNKLTGRIAFSSSYLELDSLYRQIYSELDFSVSQTWFVLGGGYAFSAEWLPGLEHWGRHRYKSGGSLLWKGLSLSAMLSGWIDSPWSEMDYAVGARFQVKERFSGFVEWNGASFDVGSAVRFAYLEIRSSYRFPDFGIALSILFCLDGWAAEGVYGSKTSNWDWFGFSVSKKIHEKTIL